MEFWLVALGIFLFVSFFLPWFNRAAISSLREELTALKSEIKELRERLGLPVQRSAHSSNQYEDAVYIPHPIEMPPSFGQPYDGSQNEVVSTEPELSSRNDVREEIYSAPTTAERSFEFNFGAKLPVWIGAISLIFAAFFLVKYSFESGLLGPTTRVSLGALFGLAMAAAGQVIVRRPHIANYERIAQGLCGAGIVCLYFCIYSAVNLYELISPSIGFVGMSVVTALAVFMSLRIGQPIALFGLIGGLATPALINSSEPNSTVLFIYLFILFTGLSFVMIRRGWWILAMASLVGVFGWTTLWFLTVFRAEETFQMLILQMSVFGIILIMTRNYLEEKKSEASEEKNAHSMNNLAMAGIVATILAMSFKVSLGLFDWSVLGVLSLAAITLAYFRPAVYNQAVWSLLIVNIILYGLWLPESDLFASLIVLAGFVTIYVLLPQYLLRVSEDPRSWGALQITSVGALYLLSYNHFEWSDTNWAYVALALCVCCIMQVYQFRQYYLKNSEIQNILVGMFAFAASAFLSVGFAILLPIEYLSVAIALQILGTLCLYKPTKIAVLDSIALILVIGFVVLQHEQIYVYATLIFTTIIDSRTPPDINQYLFDMPLLYLGVPAAALLGGVYFRSKGGDWKTALLQPVFVIGLATVLALLYYIIRDLFQMRTLSFSIEATFIERGVISFAIAALGILIGTLAEPRFKKWGAFLFYIFIGRLIWFDVLLHNPYLDGAQNVGAWTILNGITLTYLGGFLLILGTIRFHIFEAGYFSKKAYGASLLLLLLTFVSLTVRHAYHGEYLRMHHDMMPLELYTYSIVWLLLSVGLLAIGLVRDDKSIRLASLIVMTITILKVFLIDAANLEGLYRVFSFLGLGISLMGLSYFYTRFVSRADKATMNL